jgi:putative membrane protein
MSWFADLRRVLHWEVDLLRRFALLRWAIAGALVVPALYALIYLSSVWDPAAHTRALPVGVVNLDAGARYRDRPINLGAELVEALERSAEFDYRTYADVESARRDVRVGTLDFMVQIPADFSRRAVPGELPGAAKLVIYTSEGNNYTGAGFAKRFAPEVVALINAMLNETRWALVLETAAGSQRSLESLDAALGQLERGARELRGGTAQVLEGTQSLGRNLARAEPEGARLASGAATAAEAGNALTGALRQLATSLRGVESRRPPDSELAALRAGSRALVDGHRELGAGLAAAQAGALQLDDGLAQLRTGIEDIPLVGGTLADGAAQLRTGSLELANGLGTLREGQARLAGGAQRVDEGVLQLTDGVQRSGAQLAAAANRLPDEARLEAFQSGLRELAAGNQALTAGLRPLAAGTQSLQAAATRIDEGAGRLVAGVELVRGSLPGASDAPGGSPRGLATPVEPMLEVDAPVANNGTALTPNFVPLALWIGASMMAFLFHFRRIAEPAADAARSAQVAGKLVLPAVLVLLQAAVVLAMMIGVLDVKVPSPATFGLILTTASLTFLAIVFALVRMFGEIGKVVAILLLTVQLAAAGALMPIQLSGELFQAIHPFLPFTWVVKAFRASLFGAFEGAWVEPWLVVVAAGGSALALSLLFGRWRVVPLPAWRPAVDTD